MRKILCALVMLSLLALPVAGMAQSAGNLNGGGFVETDGQNVFLAMRDGVWNVADGAAAKIAGDRAENLQYADGRLYYVADEYGEDEYGDTRVLSQSVKSCLPDGSDSRVIGEARKVGYEAKYPEQDGDAASHDTYVGYRCFTVWGDRAYFMGNSDEAGQYACKAESDDGTLTTDVSYNSGIALYSMKLDGTDVVKMTGVLGNSIAQFAIADDKIYVGAGYADMIYAYNFVNYAIYDLSGNVLTSFDNASQEAWGYTSDAGKFYHILSGVMPDGDNMLVSLCQSEGDFVSSELYRLKTDGTLERVAIEVNYVPSVVDGDTLYYFGSASENIFYDDTYDYDATLGVYVCALNEAGQGEKLMPIAFEGSFSYSMKIGVAGDYVYVCGGDGQIYRVPKTGATLEKMTGEKGFEAFSQIEYATEE